MRLGVARRHITPPVGAFLGIRGETADAVATDVRRSFTAADITFHHNAAAAPTTSAACAPTCSC